MKRFFVIAVLVWGLTSCKKDQILPNSVQPPNNQEDTTTLINYNKDITIVNWNIEWFGNAALFKGNLDLQEANAGKILKYLNADLYGLCEIVDTTRLGRMVRNTLGDAFRYQVSNYPSVSGSQKLAFVYNRNIFRNIRVRPFMGLSATAYNSFAQRFPFLLTAEVVVNGKRNSCNFFLIHAKANADVTSYLRRKEGSIELKDSLDTYFDKKYVMVFGDYNDHLNSSILTGEVSPYKNFTDDPINYYAVTLPLNSQGHQSTLHYPNSVIDNQIISTPMAKWYIASSAKIRNDVTTIVPDFTTGNTSDHYPISSMYRISD